MDRQSVKTLIVDDANFMRQMVDKNLRDLGFKTITHAKNGEEAWLELENAESKGEPYRLVTLDWNMMPMDGKTLLQKLRTSLKEQPIVFMITSVGESESIVEAIQIGATAYLGKPLDSQQFKKLVDKHFPV